MISLISSFDSFFSHIIHFFKTIRIYSIPLFYTIKWHFIPINFNIISITLYREYEMWKSQNPQFPQGFTTTTIFLLIYLLFI